MTESEMANVSYAHPSVRIRGFMKVGIVAVYVDYNRRGEHHRGLLQPQIGPLIAALLPPDADVEIISDTWDEPNWDRQYDLLFISALHSDFDRARQISHYWRRRGAQTSRRAAR